jgi:outer membrane protein assembly factor BamB
VEQPSLPAAKARFAVDPQPAFRTTAARTGQAVGRIPVRAPRIAWRFQTGRPIYASPILDRLGRAYVGSLDGHEYAVDWSGRLRWRSWLGDRVYATAALAGDGLVVGSDDDKLVALDRERGQPRWSLALGPCPQAERALVGRGPESVRCDADSSAVVGADGTIYVGGDALYALAPGGAVKWRLAAGGHLMSSPALGLDGSVYVGVQGGAVIGVSAQGKLRWEHRELYDFDSTPALAPDGQLLIGCDDGRLYSLRASDGAVTWRFATRGPVRSSPALGRGGVVLFGSDDRQLRAVSSRGALRWAFSTGGPIRSSPAVDDAGTVVFGSQDDHLYALDAGGRLLWRVRLGGDVDSSVAVAPDGTLFVGADDGALYALRRQGG